MKSIKGFPAYSVSSHGTIINTVTGKEKKPTSNHSGKGYLYVDLYDNGRKSRLYVHRIVADAFIPNPDGKPYINHKDGNPQNNDVDNLEWCTPLENVIHASKTLGTMISYKKACERKKKPVYGKNFKTGEIVCSFESIRDASRRLDIPSSNIVANLKGRQAHTKGICWCYVEELS